MSRKDLSDQLQLLAETLPHWCTLDLGNSTSSSSSGSTNSEWVYRMDMSVEYKSVRTELLSLAKEASVYSHGKVGEEKQYFTPLEL